MAGLVEGAQEAPAPAAEGISPETVRAKMQIPGNLSDAYERIVLAGKKILYSEQMQDQVQAVLQGPGETGEKLARGVVGLMAILITQANGTMPPQLILPAAVELITEAGDFLKKAGVKVTDEDIAEGTAVMIQEILSRAGVTPEQIPELLKSGGQPPAEQAAPAPEQLAPEQAAPAPDQQPLPPEA